MFSSSDRLVLIYCPSRSKWYCQVEKAKLFVGILAVILLLANGHILYGYERLSIGPVDCNIHPGDVLYNRFFHFYDSYIESVCFVLIPFILMSLCSILIIVQIVESRRTVRGKRVVFSSPRLMSLFQCVKVKDLVVALGLRYVRKTFNYRACSSAHPSPFFYFVSPLRSTIFSIISLTNVPVPIVFAKFFSRSSSRSTMRDISTFPLSPGKSFANISSPCSARKRSTANICERLIRLYFSSFSKSIARPRAFSSSNRRQIS